MNQFGRCPGFAARALAAALFLPMAGAIFAAAAAHADGGPVGDEYAINDRALPPKAWWTSCTDEAGRRATILNNCEGAGCDEPGNLLLQRYDAAGKKLGAPVKINDEPAWRLGFRVSCSDGGWVAAQWVEQGCYRHRAFTPQDQPAGTAIVAGGQDCRVRPNVAIDDAGGTLAAWPEWLPSAGSQILVRRYAASGVPIGDSAQVSDGTAGWRVQPKVAIDESGVALVAWLGSVGYDDGHGPVVGRFVGAGGAPEGDAFDISTFAFGENSDPAIRRLGGAAFEVAWNNPLEGGRVAREVHAGGASPASARAVASAAASLPRFGAARIVDSYRSSAGRASRLAAGDDSTWFVSDGYARHWRTGDDSTSWTGPFSVAGGDFGREITGSNGDGVWISLNIADGSSLLDLARSADDGQSWSSLDVTLDGPNAGFVFDARVRGAGSTWVAAWAVPGANDEASSLVFARSTDGGATWSNPKAVFTGASRGRFGMELATDGSGTWILMLADAGVRFLRSTDDGKSWSAPGAVVQDAACLSCAGSWRYDRVGLAADGGGNWVAIFAAPLLGSNMYGRDGDLFVLRSDDDGQNWSSPAPLAAYSATDGSHDYAPQLATDGSGKWLAAWISHHPVGGNDDLDSDVVVAVSTDLGESWSAPALLVASMASDEAADSHVSLASGGGHWMAVWERTGFSGISGLASDDLLVAVANATCGNGITEAGEACDDGNTADDDGCDSNCTTGGCGNGIVNEGEACDDGNSDNGDMCSTLCEAPRCGDGIVSPLETCDDGNDLDTDECPNNCGAPGCGDGIVQTGVEDCDSGGQSSSTCTPECRFAICGDGYVAPRAEACDDGNDVDDDACPNDCSRAVCGDGFASLGWEECDPAEPLYANACTADCRLVGLCGDVNADAEVTVGDARQILRRAVGLSVDCPQAACDMDSSGTISVLDSHLDLRKAVGIDVGENCSIGTGTIVFWIDETRPLGAFQFDVDYTSTGGQFAGTGGTVACRSDIADKELDDPETPKSMLIAFNDDDQYGARNLTAGIVALVSFSGRLDLFECEFEMPDDRADAHFAIRVIDATDPDGEAIEPLPLVGYRVE